MQKLIKRTAEAQRAAARRMKKKSLAKSTDDKHERLRDQKRQVADIAKDLRQARVTRRENWELGPAAPLRDIDANKSHAASDVGRFAPQSRLKEWELEQRCAWAGGVKYLNLAVRDRVVVTEGPFKGTIDYIESIDKTTATVKLLDSAKFLTKIPDYLLDVDSTYGRTSPVPASIPISAIRLIHPLYDSKTGLTRDVIIRQLSRGPATYHRASSWRAWERHVTGENVSIPWPEQEPANRHDQPDDTVRVAVEEPTFVPTLLRCPVPPKLIDELRNRYSKFRTRHEEEYVMRKEQEEAERRAAQDEASRHKAAADAGMLTPLQQLNREQRATRKAKGQPMLSAEMLAKIGQVIARNKADALREAGLSEVNKTQ